MSVMQPRTSRVEGSTDFRASSRESCALSPLLDAVIAGQPGVWQAFQQALAPQLERWARAHRAFRRRKLAASIDDVRDVMVATLERLSAEEFQNLRRFRSAHPDCSEHDLSGWLYGTFDYALREHLRARFGRLGRRSELRPGQEGPSKRDLHTLAQRLETEPMHEHTSGATTRVCAREIDAFVAQHFSAREALVLRAYIADDACFGALADEFALGGREDAQRFVRKLKERLRARFKRNA